MGVGLVQAFSFQMRRTSLATISENAGDSALRQVQWMGKIVAQKEQAFASADDPDTDEADESKVVGTGGSSFNMQKNEVSSLLRAPPKEKQVWEALANLENDSE